MFKPITLLGAGLFSFAIYSDYSSRLKYNKFFIDDKVKKYICLNLYEKYEEKLRIEKLSSSENSTESYNLKKPKNVFNLVVFSNDKFLDKDKVLSNKFVKELETEISSDVNNLLKTIDYKINMLFESIIDVSGYIILSPFLIIAPIFPIVCEHKYLDDNIQNIIKNNETKLISCFNKLNTDELVSTRRHPSIYYTMRNRN